MTPLTDVKFPRNADFHPTTRKLPIVWVEILSGHLDCLLGLGIGISFVPERWKDATFLGGMLTSLVEMIPSWVG